MVMFTVLPLCSPYLGLSCISMMELVLVLSQMKQVQQWHIGESFRGTTDLTSDAGMWLFMKHLVDDG